MTKLYLYDDAKAREFEPFALTRPVSELRAGAEIIRARWERVAGITAHGFIGASQLINFEEAGAPPATSLNDTIPPGSLIANSRCVVALDAALDDNSASFSCDGVLCAVRTARPIAASELGDGTVQLEELADDSMVAVVNGRWLQDVWAPIGTLADQLADDIPVMAAQLHARSIQDATVMGNHGVYCEPDSVIEPFVLLDASSGPILIRRGATISSFTRIVGPTYIGRDSMIVGDAVRACSIGDVCKVRGEIAGSVMLSHSNKGHTGFIGSSYVGKWVNLGAGTTTSNLKNTYGPVQLWTPSGMRNTGLQFLGSLIGDHAKTGIGLMLTTGTVIGAGANIYGARGVPKRVPPFAWGDSEPYGRYAIDKFVEVAERMMARRHVELGDKARRQLADCYVASAEAAARS